MGILQGSVPGPDAQVRRSWIAPLSILAALVLAGAAWTMFVALRDQIPIRTFDSPQLGCRFTYPSRLVAGPNFVRARTDAVLTIERHSLIDADPEFVRALPESLYPQVRIQLDQVFRGLTELSKQRATLGGRPSLQVHLTGTPGTLTSATDITVDIAATKDWVYVLRATIPDGEVAKDRADFDHVRGTLEFAGGDAAEARP